MSKILIVEDDAPYQKVYKRKFEVAGFAVEVASDGEEGLEKIRTFQPDIVFLDVMMPKMDGFQVLDHAKADPAIQDIPVVITTNLATDDDNQKLIKKGAASVVVKSNTEPSELVRIAEEILGQKKTS